MKDSSSLNRPLLEDDDIDVELVEGNQRTGFQRTNSLTDVGSEPDTEDELDANHDFNEDYDKMLGISRGYDYANPLRSGPSSSSSSLTDVSFSSSERRIAGTSHPKRQPGIAPSAQDDFVPTDYEVIFLQSVEKNRGNRSFLENWLNES